MLIIKDFCCIFAGYYVQTDMNYGFEIKIHEI